MLKSPKAKRLGEQFAIQWLEMKKLKDPAFRIDLDVYPGVTPKLTGHMVDEVSLFFNNIVAETESFLALLDSDYTYMNEDLKIFNQNPLFQNYFQPK